jgi:hypothetical protein
MKTRIIEGCTLNPIFVLSRHPPPFGAWNHHTIGPLDFVELSKRLPVEAQTGLKRRHPKDVGT